MVSEIDVTFQSTGFPGAKVIALQLTLPPTEVNVGFELRNDDIYNLPYYSSCIPTSFVHSIIPSKYRQNYFILAINADYIITAKYMKEKLIAVQKQDDRRVTIDIVKRGPQRTQTPLSMSRAIFDQIPTFQMNIINVINVPSTHSHFVRSPSKLPVPKLY